MGKNGLGLRSSAYPTCTVIGLEVIEIATVAMLLSILPSLTLNVKLSVSLKLASGIKIRLGGVPPNEPCAGGVTIENVNGSPSATLPVKVICFGTLMTAETL